MDITKTMMEVKLMNSIQLDKNDVFIKVPVIITSFFWIIKILATTVGETGADFLIFNLHFGLVVTSLLMASILVAVIYAQIKSKHYIPWLYWLTVVLVSIAGTLITDLLTDNFQVPLAFSTLIFSITLILTFYLWYKTEGSLSIHSIYNAKRESFYWLAILITFALGTAAGDLFGETIGLGYGLSALIFGSAILLITLGFYIFKLNRILVFWMAYILTRPMGASIGDYLSQTHDNGGLGLGTTGTSAIFLISIILLVTYISIAKVDSPPTPSN